MTEIIPRPTYPSLVWDWQAFLNTARTGQAVRLHRSGETEDFWARRLGTKAKAFGLVWTMKYDGEYIIAWCDVPQSQKSVPETLAVRLTETVSIRAG